jgi:hypothetical protein
MYYIYVLYNKSYPPNTYKIDITQQNPNKLQKHYNKFYIENIQIMHTFFIKDKNKALSEIIQQLSPNIISINKLFVTIEIASLISVLSAISDHPPDHETQNIVLNLITSICVEHEGSNLLVNNMYNFCSFKNDINYIHFLYILKNSNYNIITIDNKYYAKDLRFKHDNLYELFISSNIKYDASNNNFIGLSQIMQKYNEWHKKTFPYLQLLYKIDSQKAMIAAFEHKYGKIQLNYNCASKYKNGWNCIKFDTIA